jgi:hypothetical protein
MNTTNLFRRFGKFVFGLIIASAMIISSCEAVSGPGGLANGDAALSASRGNVGQPTVITTVTQLEQIGVSLASDGEYQLGDDLILDDWTPLCGPSAPLGPFTGTFDGADHTLTVNSFADDAIAGKYLGIFAVLGSDAEDPSVSNLTVVFEPGPILSKPVQYVGGFSAYARNTAFSNITVIGTFEVTSGTATADVPNLEVGGVTGFAASSSFTDVLVLADFDTSFYGPPPPPQKWEIWRGDDTFRVRPTAPGDIGEDGLATGGVAGYAKNSQFSNNLVAGKMNVTGITQSTPVYVGGVVGSATGTNVDDSDTAVEITGNGPGYNTSAGGVAGYITGSRVRNSSAEGGRVDLRGESVDFDWGASWQVYAGGLVGYAGGSDAAPSLVDHSYATSTVYAYSPYPYAGGLVGYLYGFNDFITPAKNGSTVSRSYATGSATANVQVDTAHNIADIPYAGGLVGYSSVTGSTIVDSYATGPATATTEGTYAWAGGLVGGNANNAVVLRTYAIGAVTSTTGTRAPLYAPLYADAGPAAGGIAGFNYYSPATLVSHSVALNRIVYGNQSTTQNVIRRVAGSLGNTTGYIGTLDTNYAYDNMSVGNNWTKIPGLNLPDGADIASPPPQTFYTTDLGWDFVNIWQPLTGTYPTLR